MIRFRASSLLIALGLLIWGCQPPAEPPAEDPPPVSLTIAWELNEGLQKPESVVYDSERDVLYISNIAGDFAEKNGKGYIARVSTDGELLDSVWIAGLNAPKGLDIHNGYLYAADVDELIEIDLASNTVTARYPALESQFLNDVAAHSSGDVFVTDSRANQIYRLHEGVLSLWMAGDAIKAVNGVFAEDDHLLVAAHGGNAENPGANRYMMTVSLENQQVAPIRDEIGIGGLDGIKPDGTGGYFLSDWAGGKVYHYTAADGAKEVFTLTQGTADLEYVPESKRLFLPVMMSDRLVAFSVE